MIKLMRLKRKTKYAVAQAITLLCLAFSNIAFANKVLFENRDPIQLNVLASFPFGYQNEQGKNVGTYWEYLQKLGKYSDLNIDPTIVPKARVVKYLQQGLSDGAILFKSKKLAPYVQYVSLIRGVPIVIATRSDIDISQYEDLHQLELVGVFRSGSVSERFDNDHYINKHEIASYPMMIEMLKKNRVQAIVGNGVVLETLIAKQCLDQEIKISQVVLGSKEQWLVLSNQSTHLDKIDKLKVAVTSLRKNGSLDTIFLKHHSLFQSACH